MQELIVGIGKVDISLPIEDYTSVFQAELYGTLHCSSKNNIRVYAVKLNNRCTDSQAATGTLRSLTMDMLGRT